jgi:predicted RNA-binding protein with PIN domain
MTTMRELIDEINAATARLRELSDEMSREREEQADDMDAGQRLRLHYWRAREQERRRLKEERGR